MSENGLVREHHAGDGRVEAGGDRASDTAADEHICCQDTAGGLTKKASHRRAEMHQRAILSDRGTAAGRDEGRQRRAETGPHIKLIIGTVRRIDAVGRTVPAGNPEQAPDNQDQAGGDDKAQQRGQRYVDPAKRQPAETERLAPFGQRFHPDDKPVGDDRHHKTETEAAQDPAHNGPQERCQIGSGVFSVRVHGVSGTAGSPSSPRGRQPHTAIFTPRRDHHTGFPPPFMRKP